MDQQNVPPTTPSAAPPESNNTKQIIIIVAIILGVIILIIGIFAAMTLVGLSGARSKAKDARIKSSLSENRVEAEIFYSDHQTYVGFSPNPDSIKNIQDSGSNIMVQGLSSNTFVIYARLTSSDLLYCIDNRGFTGEINNISASQTACQ